MARTIAIMSLIGSLAYTGMQLFEARKGYDLEINKQTKLLHIASEKGGSFYNFKKENNLYFFNDVLEKHIYKQKKMPFITIEDKQYFDSIAIKFWCMAGAYIKKYTSITAGISCGLLAIVSALCKIIENCLNIDCIAKKVI